MHAYQEDQSRENVPAHAVDLVHMDHDILNTLVATYLQPRDIHALKATSRVLYTGIHKITPVAPRVLPIEICLSIPQRRK